MRLHMKIFHIIILLAIFNLFIFSFDLKRENKNLTKLKREIHLLNLINGLDLTNDQMKIIKEKVEERVEIEEWVRKRLESKEKELFSVLDEIRNYLREGKEIPDSLKQRYHRIHTEIKREIMTADKRIKNLALEVKNILKDHQKYQLHNFVPCIIPPKGELRIGQANDYSGAIRQLERIRKIPERVYLWNKERIIYRTIERMKLHLFPWNEVDEKEMEIHLSKIFNKVRSLSDADFQLQKDKLAEELISPFLPERKKPDLVSKIKFFLLSPEIITILEQRLSS